MKIKVSPRWQQQQAGSDITCLECGREVKAGGPVFHVLNMRSRPACSVECAFRLERATLVLTLEKTARAAWKTACEHEGIDPASKFVTFADSNPWNVVIDRAWTALMMFKRPLSTRQAWIIGDSCIQQARLLREHLPKDVVSSPLLVREVGRHDSPRMMLHL